MCGAHNQPIALGCALAVQVIEHHMLGAGEGGCSIRCWGYIQQSKLQVRRHHWGLFRIIIWRWHGIAVTAARQTIPL